ncbi:MAG: hypothetical protein IJC02_04220 [Lachnospiraceae bacterium]|nr:hypothetical protein [Lachnospiraceae bacterium]MBQ6995973.1 hypothetical protein [Lachnospiraceae bacterium]
MTKLLVLREQLKRFYGKYEVYITPVLKFVLAFMAFTMINQVIGYMGALNNIAIVLVLALFCSFLPLNLTVVLAAAVALVHLYAFSLECAVVALAVFLLMFILYFRFSPKDAVVVLLTPLFFVFKIPYVVPIAMGLIGTPVSAVSVACGVIVYYVIGYMNESASALNAFDTEGAVEKFRYIIDGVLGNKTMLVVLVAFAATIVIVYFIRRLSIDYAWTIAIITGTLVNILLLLFGDLMFNTNVSIVGLIIGSVISALLVKVLEFFVFNVDYSRTEMVQFEDDEYYYYVKAVPKNTVATPEKRVKTIRVPDKAVNHPQRNSETKRTLK